MAESIATNLASELGKLLFAPIGRQFGYVLSYKKNVQDLNERVEKLEAARDSVRKSVKEAENSGKPIKSSIIGWLEKAEEEAKGARILLGRAESAKNACFHGWLLNPVVRHPIGRKVKKTTLVIKGLYDETTERIFQKVFDENPPIGCPTPTPFDSTSTDNTRDVLESRAKITEEVMRALVDDKVRVIGVYGPGGVGKSKLLKDVERQVREKNLFGMVAVAYVKRNRNIERIQSEIIDSLGMHLVNEKTVLGRAQRLNEKLESDSKKKILIILDDLWEKLELKEIGIPCDEDDDNKVKGCKLLLTSRNRDVLRVAMCSDKEFPLDMLNHEEARILFERTVGDRANDPEFEPLVDGVVKNCGGLPLLIAPVAKRLKDKDLAAWRNAWSNRDLSDVKSLVEQSYNDIREERIRSLFLACALTNGTIHTRDSLIYCMGLGFYKKYGNTIQKARDMLIGDLRTLQDSSLLQESDSMEVFKMHDIFVDVAISMHDEFTDMKWNAWVGKEDYGFKECRDDELRKCTAISFSLDGNDDLPQKLDCPNLRMIIFDGSASLQIPESFFESVEKLQVLDLTCFSFTTLPPSIQVLEHLKSLSLDFCNLEDVTLLGKLKGLQFLSFFRSTIARLPIEIGELTELRFLYLNGCRELEIVEPGVLESLVNLEELYIDSFCQWEADDEAPRRNASLAELKNMKKLKTLHIAILQSTNLSSDLPFGNLNEHKIQIGGNPLPWGESTESRTLKLKLDSDNLLQEVWVQQCLGRTQDLRLDGLKDGRDSIHDLCNEGFQELKHLHVENNLSFQYVVDFPRYPTFTKLESLVLENLDNLKEICHDCLAQECFSRLKTVIVKNCGEIKHLFPSSMTGIFLQLQEIEISRCQLIQEIVANAEIDEYKDERDDDANVKLSKLRRLTLQNLPNMTSFYKTREHSVIFFDGQQVSLPWLESLTLSELPKLKEIWNSQSSSDVSNLKLLEVKDCEFLLSIIPSNLMIKLQNLEVITVERCQLLREVFNLEGLTVSGDVKILSRLTTLTLSDLPSLGHILSRDPRRALCLQNLRALKVQNCENLKFLFSSSMSKTLQQIREIEIVSCRLLEEIIDVQEEESKEAASTDTIEFSSLTSLSLKKLPNLRTFCCGRNIIHCPALTRVRISECPKMTTFSSFEGKQQSIRANTNLEHAFGDVNSGLSSPILFDQNVLFPSLEELTIISCGLMKIWHNELSEESFCKLASIRICDCDNLSHIFPSTSIDRFWKLKTIEVVKCNFLEALVEHVAVYTKKRQKRLVFLDLKEVKLWDLPRLNALVPSSTKATLILPSLTNICLHNCHSLRYLFTNETSRNLDKLEKLDVSDCENMQEVVAMEENEERNLKAQKFPNLLSLTLCFLKSLISFSSGSCSYEFPSLRKLSILNCTKFKAFILRLPAPRVETMTERLVSFDESPHSLFDEKVVFPKLEQLRLTGIQSRGLWEYEMPDESICQPKILEVKQCPNLLNVIPSFMWKRLLPCMESLTVEECPCLRNLFTMSMTKSLVRVQYLALGGCEEMEYIVAAEEEKPEETTDIVVIPELVTLSLCKMIKLRSFYQGKHISEWPSMKEFTVDGCKAVEVILGEASCRRLEGNVPMHQPLLLVKKGEFPHLESMKISHMANMEKIWVDEYASNAFTKLKTLMVEYCEKLSFIFASVDILVRFQNLEKLIVTDCDSLEVVFQVQELHMKATCSPSSFQLREIILERLPKMKHVWSGHPRGTLAFECLRCLAVVRCVSLKSLFPSSVAKNSTQLEQLIVRECGVEEIIAEEEGGAEIKEGDHFFPRLTELVLADLLELRSFYRESHTSTWPLLRELTVAACGNMRLFSFSGEIQSCHGDSTTNEILRALFSAEKVIPHLERLTLTPESVAMMQHYTFPHLKHLELSRFDEEDEAFPSNFLLHRFPNLEMLLVVSSSFEEIFPEEESSGQGEASLEALGNLKLLDLTQLCNLSRLWKDGSLMAKLLQQIEVLILDECPNLSIALPSPISFQRLTEITLVNCSDLVHMGTCSAVTSLAHLTLLIINDCGKMEDVVTDDGDGVEEVSFPKLHQLTLEGLPCLQSFSPANCAFRFPSLVLVLVKQCPKMNIFCMGALTTPRLEKVRLSSKGDVWRWEDDLNTTIQTLST